jgi:two-component system chemotaxis response regulator CheY
MKILIIDDSRTMRSILTSFAQNLGLETSEAGDGVEALEVLDREGAFDAALIDWDMPRMDGITLLREIRANPAFAEMKAMMVTAQSDFENVTEAIMAGADDYLMKPLDEAMFVDKLRLIGVV